MDLAGTEQAGACGWALNEGFKSGMISKREGDVKKRTFITHAWGFHCCTTSDRWDSSAAYLLLAA